MDEGESAEIKDTRDPAEVTAQKLVNNCVDDGGRESLNEVSGEFDATANAKRDDVAGEYVCEDNRVHLHYYTLAYLID